MPYPRLPVSHMHHMRKYRLKSRAEGVSGVLIVALLVLLFASLMVGCGTLTCSYTF